VAYILAGVRSGRLLVIPRPVLRSLHCSQSRATERAQRASLDAGV